MQAIEFEATTFQHTIRVPDSVPDGVSLRVLLLIDEAKTSQHDNTGEHIGAMPDAGHEAVVPEDSKPQAALAHIAAVRANWQGKPIADREALYDTARGT